MPDKRIMNVAEAIREATDTCMERDDRVFLMGEGVADPAAIFGTTRGLADKYGANRVIEMPVAENGFTGVAIGAAMMGRRPIIIHQRVDFSLLSLEQLFDNAAKTCYVTRGQHTVPLVVRMIIGRGWGQGPAHSQSLESIFAHVPGLKVVAPYSAADAKGLLKSAIRDPNPVLILENEMLYGTTFDVPDDDDYTVPIGRAKIVRAGGDVTITAFSLMVGKALEAAEMLAAEGIEAEVIDLRSIRPLDTETVVESVKRTNRIVSVEEGWPFAGVGSEIGMRMMEDAFDYLDSPVVRVTGEDVPMPYAANLEKLALPQTEKIVAAAKRVCYKD